MAGSSKFLACTLASHWAVQFEMHGYAMYVPIIVDTFVPYAHMFTMNDWKSRTYILTVVIVQLKVQSYVGFCTQHAQY